MLYYSIYNIFFNSTNSFYQRDAFPGHPSNGENCSSLNPVVITLVHVSRHPKISYSYFVASSQQTVSRSQISMHKVQRWKVIHTGCNLDRNFHQGFRSAKNGYEHYRIFGKVTNNFGYNFQPILETIFYQNSWATIISEDIKHRPWSSNNKCVNMLQEYCAQSRMMPRWKR